MSRDTKREIIMQRIKIVKRLENELNRIRTAQFELGYMVLDKPVRDGWIKTFKLRDDILRTKKFKVYHEVLSAIVKEIWGREKRYADKRWDDFFSRNIKNFQRPGIRRLDEKEYSKLSTKAKKCFIEQKRKSYRGYKSIYSCILPRYYFVLSYRRAYTIKRKIISPVLKRREQEVLEILAKPEFRAFSVYYNNNYRLYFNTSKSERRRTKMALSLIKEYRPELSLRINT